MERKEFEAFVEERLEEIRLEWAKFSPFENSPICISVFPGSYFAFAFQDDSREKKCVDIWRNRNDPDS